FTPEARSGHEAVLVDEMLYFMGGSIQILPTNQTNLSDEVFYLNLSSQFTIDNPPFMDITNTSRMPYGNEK
ncbi:3149_t:CDS:1, partial [Dentiscutata erythropus]